MSLKKQIAILIFGLLFVSVFYAQQITNQDVIAKIKIEQVGETINIKGTATNTTEVIKSLRYNMLVIKKNLETSNLSRSEQDGRFTLTANASKELSLSTINRNIKDKVTVLLLIYDSQNKLLGKDRLVVLNDDEKKENKNVVIGSQKVNDGITLRGVVIDDTKTKSGRDFYTLFFSRYNLSQIKAKQIINIEERLSLGRNTNIIIEVDRTIIHQFPARPNRDFLKQMVEATMTNLVRYLQNIEKQKTLIKQY